MTIKTVEFSGIIGTAWGLREIQEMVYGIAQLADRNNVEDTIKTVLVLGCFIFSDYFSVMLYDFILRKVVQDW